LDLHLSFGEDTGAPMGMLVDALIRIECIYNILAFMEGGSEPDHYNKRDLAADERLGVGGSAFANTGVAGVSRDVVQTLRHSVGLRGRIDTRLQLHVQEITTGSFKISVSGLAEAINALAKIFDPQQRSADRERLRHARIMNRVHEDREVASLLAEKLDLMEEVQKSKERMIRRYVNHGYPREAAEAAVAMLVDEVAHLTQLLKSDETDLVAIPKDY
jgi:hypothetical protein